MRLSLKSPRRLFAACSLTLILGGCALGHGIDLPQAAGEAAEEKDATGDGDTGINLDGGDGDAADPGGQENFGGACGDDEHGVGGAGGAGDPAECEATR